MKSGYQFMIKYSNSIHDSQAFLYPICIGSLYDSDMNLKQVIADWIRRAREHAELSQEGLGSKLAIEFDSERGYTKANISHWETQKHEPSIQQLLAIKKITNYPFPKELLDAMGGTEGEKVVTPSGDKAEGEDFVMLFNGFLAANKMERDVMLSSAQAALENASIRNNVITNSQK